MQQLGLPVDATGAPEPSLAVPPAPYASPLGFGDDITDWLAVKGNPNVDSEAKLAFQRMFLNINPAVEGAVDGVVVAARSGPSYEQKDPDYEYTWVRDASLTMDVVATLYTAATKRKVKQQYEEILFEYAGARATEQNDPDLITGLGEPKVSQASLMSLLSCELILISTSSISTTRRSLAHGVDHRMMALPLLPSHLWSSRTAI